MGIADSAINLIRKIGYADYTFAEVDSQDPRVKALGQRVNSMPYRYFRNSINVDIYEQGVVFAWNSYRSGKVKHNLEVCYFSGLSNVAKGMGYNLILGILALILFGLGAYYNAVVLLPAIIVGFLSIEKEVAIQFYNLVSDENGNVKPSNELMQIKINMRGGPALVYLTENIDGNAALAFDNDKRCKMV